MTTARRLADGYSGAWRRSRPRGRLVLVLAGLLTAALAGAFLFGAWHVVVGGLVKGNPRAAAFGVGLATVSGLALAAVGYVGRRVMPEGSGPGDGAGPGA